VKEAERKDGTVVEVTERETMSYKPLSQAVDCGADKNEKG
jgi:hypothetical protein